MPSRFESSQTKPLIVDGTNTPQFTVFTEFFWYTAVNTSERQFVLTLLLFSLAAPFRVGEYERMVDVQLENST